MNRKANQIVFVLIAFSALGGCGEDISLHINQLESQVAAGPNTHEGQVALAELIDRLNDKDSKDSFGRTAATEALGNLGTLAQRAVPDLIRAVDCGDRFVETEAIHALARMGPLAEPSAEVLVRKINSDMLMHEVGSSTWYAAECLGNLNPTNTKAIAILKRGAKTNDENLVRIATTSLNRLHANDEISDVETSFDRIQLSPNGRYEVKRERH
jgi:PBS lyase HEAT-like repeat-containing protein